MVVNVVVVNVVVEGNVVVEVVVEGVVVVEVAVDGVVDVVAVDVVAEELEPHFLPQLNCPEMMETYSVSQEF